MKMTTQTCDRSKAKRKHLGVDKIFIQMSFSWSRLITISDDSNCQLKNDSCEYIEVMWNVYTFMCMLHSQVKTMTSKNEEKKVRRKQRRAQQMINAETNVECCDESTEVFFIHDIFIKNHSIWCFHFNFQHLVVCNAGLVTGLRQELLLNELERFGAVDDIVMLKGKSYCFVRCSDASNAKTIYENVHGRSELGQNDGPLYLSFCKKSN